MPQTSAVNLTPRAEGRNRGRLPQAESQEAYDRITRLAASILETPMAFISVADGDRLILRSRFGLDITEVPIRITFCSLAMTQNGPLVIPDAAVDPRFSANPMVLGAPNIRFYAGHPIFNLNGRCVGTFCVLDSQARTLDAEQASRLADLAHTAEDLMKLAELQQHSVRLLADAKRESVRFQATFEQSVVGIAHVSPRGEWLRVNGQLCRMLGYSEAELRSLTFQDLTHPEDLANDLDLHRQLLAGEIPGYSMEKRYFRKDGSDIWVELNVSVVRNQDGRLDFLVKIVEDISRRKAAETALRESRDTLKHEVLARTAAIERSNGNLRTLMQRFSESAEKRRRSEEQIRLVIDGVPGRIAYWSVEQRCVYCNKAFVEWMGGGEPIDFMGRGIEEIMPAAILDSARPSIEAALAGEEQHFERQVTNADGSQEFEQVSYLPDLDGAEVRGFLAFAVDVTDIKLAQIELQDANAQLERETVTDHLTGLRNRRYFSARGAEAFAKQRRLGQPYGLLLFDLDHFKKINDRYGHDAGDAVLVALGRVLSQNVRTDIEAAMRIGGEEFAIVFYGDVTEESAAQFGERIRRLVEAESIDIGEGNQIKVTISAGVALSDPADKSWDDVFRRADRALYVAKGAGRNCVRVAAPDQDAASAPETKPRLSLQMRA
jgi:diguanylate cyclase (GGDEF)-like protein/PAS domain S-box-containing protein